MNQEEPKMKLKGSKLLARISECSELSKSDLAIACGYSKRGIDGKIKPAFTPFYEALLEAKNVQLNENIENVLDKLKGASPSSVSFNYNLATRLTGNKKKLEDYSEKEACDLVRKIIHHANIDNIEKFSLISFSPSDNEWNGFANSKRWELIYEEDEETITFTIYDIEYDEQFRDIQEILAGPDRERPGLDDFFKSMALKLRNPETAFWEAWNEIVFDCDGKGTILGNAIADFRDGELIERLGYIPESDTLDDALEQWISDEYIDT